MTSFRRPKPGFKNWLISVFGGFSWGDGEYGQENRSKLASATSSLGLHSQFDNPLATLYNPAHLRGLGGACAVRGSNVGLVAFRSAKEQCMCGAKASISCPPAPFARYAVSNEPLSFEGPVDKATALTTATVDLW